MKLINFLGITLVLILILFMGCENEVITPLDQAKVDQVDPSGNLEGIPNSTIFYVVDPEGINEEHWVTGMDDLPLIFCYDESEVLFPGCYYFDTGEITNTTEEHYIEDWITEWGYEEEVEQVAKTQTTTNVTYTGGAVVPLDQGGSEKIPLFIEAPPTVTYPVNYSFEDWTSSLPDHWNKSTELGGVSIPTIWGPSYFYAVTPTVLVQSTDEYVGTYAIDLRTYTVDKVLASSWYEIPQAYRINGANWWATIRYKANAAAAGADGFYLALEVQFLDAQGNAQGGEPSISAVFDPDQTSYTVIQTDYDTYTSSPHYVRFAVRQTGGGSAQWFVKFDDLHLYNGADVSLPVSLYSFVVNDIYQNGGAYYADTDWTTMSEIDNAYFYLYFEHPTNGLTLASGQSEPGAGTTYTQQNYQKDWILNTAAVTYWNSLSASEKMYFQIVSEDYSSELHYYPEKRAYIEK